ncbi:glycosyltransferase family 4 protein [Polaribacter sp. M15]
MKIIVLWASLSDYMVASFRELANKKEVELVLIYQPAKSEAPFNPFDLSFCVNSYEDKDKNFNTIASIAKDFDPDIIFMASWNFKHYMKLSKQYRKSNIPVISCFDNQWSSSLRQHIAKIIAPYFLKPVINNFIIPGDRQAQFAKRLGYLEPHQGFYCANTTNFQDQKPNLQARRFVFVGRFIAQKSIKELVEAYKMYRQSVSNPWSLMMVGAGPLKYLCKDIDGIEVENFSQPRDLPSKLAESSCFILPSKHENWGLVIHEAALVGLPLICTSACGATTWFLREGQNGYLTSTKQDSIKNAMIKIHELPLEKLNQMSVFSNKLGSLWTIDKWANNAYNSFKSYIK